MRKLISTLIIAGLALGMQPGLALAAKPKGDRPQRTPEEMFKRRDKNNDGKLTPDEMQGKKGGDTEKAKQRFSRLDKNGDGGITLDEMKARGKKK